MVQLWVNLPKKDKKSPPSYQGSLASQIPEVELPEGAGKVRVIAGEWEGKAGPARTFTRMNVWDVRMKNGHSFSVSVSEGDSAAVFVLSGRVRIGDEQIGESEFAIFEHAGNRVELTATEDSKILFLSGEPIPEPIVGYGPFVMNTPDEIRQAFVDYQEGRMGQLVASSR